MADSVAKEMDAALKLGRLEALQVSAHDGG